MQPPTKRIVYTRHDDGGVSVHCPTGPAFYWAQRGGMWGNRPHGFFDEQVRRQVASGIPEPVAHRWIDALQFGGLTEAETWGLIADRCHNPSGHLHELMEFADLPSRWFRDAWYRSPNGGPVGVNLEKARPIQFRKIKAAEKLERQRRDLDLDMWRKPIRIPWLTIERAIKHARDDGELRRVWPESLPKPS